VQFREVIGQKELKEHLIREINSGKISHAQLFTGKAGFGGFPLALAFVQYLFCEQRSDSDSCGTCASCKKVSGMIHPDVHFTFPIVLAADKGKLSDSFIEPWRSQVVDEPYFDLNDWVNRIDPKERKPIIGTEQSQEIIRKLALKSYEGGYKVMFIWMAEEMNATCANKLLKILEEPPEKTLFILLSDAQDKLLATIVSRTQLVKIPRLNSDDISLFLRNKLNLSLSSAQSIVSRAEGDLIEARRIAEANADQDANRDLFIQLMRVCYKRDVIAMLDWAEDAAGLSKEKQKLFLQYALHMFRQSLLRNYTEDQLTRVSDEEDAFLMNFARFVTGNNIFDFSNAFNEAHYHIERNANARILFTELCFNVMRFIHKA
jgi:DNA polymerase-3 subunit delta'